MDGNIMNLSVGEFRCHGLKRLYLKWVALDVTMFENIIARCPLIEVLEIWYIQRFDSFKVTKLNNLRELIVRLFQRQRVEVEAPNLEMLTCNDKEAEGDMDDEDYMIPFYITLCCSQHQNFAVSFTNQGAEVEAPRLELFTCMNRHFVGTPTPCWLNLPASQYQILKSLSLCAVEISVNLLANMANKFPHLEDLCIQNCRILRRIKIYSHSLERIQLVDNGELEGAQSDVPSIDRFEYHWDNWSKDIMPQFSFAAASSCWTSHINIIYMDCVDSSLYLELREFLRRLIPSEISIRVCFTHYVPPSVAVMENSVTVPERQEIKESWVNFFGELSLSSVLSVLDNIFRTCHPHIRWHVYDKKYTKLIYDMLIFRKNQGHPNLQNFKEFKFWQHDLMDVKVDIFRYGMFPNGSYMFPTGSKLLRQNGTSSAAT